MRTAWLCGPATLTVLLALGGTAAAQHPEMLVSTDWLAAHLRDTRLLVLCIADDESFYSAGHIPAARLVRLSEITTTSNGVPNQLPSAEHLQKVFENAGVSDNSRVVLYGERSGVMAARAYFTLDYLGLGNTAALLDGGIEKWRSEHRPTTKGRPHIQPGKLHIHVQRDALVDTGFMSAIARSSNAFVLLDARPKPEYTGLRLSEGSTESGHIPGARSLYWQELLVPGDVPQLLPISELKDKFASAGADPGAAVITYCRTGMQSSFDYFVAKYLGYRVQMYVGSFYEWTKSSHGGQTSAFCH